MRGAARLSSIGENSSLTTTSLSGVFDFLGQFMAPVKAKPMSTDREKTAGFIILAKCFVETVPYDARGGFVLLHSMAREMGPGALQLVDGAAHLHVLAGLGDITSACEDARESMSHLVSVLERRLAQKPAV